jgi:hypothetical protein
VTALSFCGEVCAANNVGLNPNKAAEIARLSLAREGLVRRSWLQCNSGIIKVSLVIVVSLFNQIVIFSAFTT